MSSIQIIPSRLVTPNFNNLGFEIPGYVSYYKPVLSRTIYAKYPHGKICWIKRNKLMHDYN